jgi:hypothetical protein
VGLSLLATGSSSPGIKGAGDAKNLRCCFLVDSGDECVIAAAMFATILAELRFIRLFQSIGCRVTTSFADHRIAPVTSKEHKYLNGLRLTETRKCNPSVCGNENNAGRETLLARQGMATLSRSSAKPPIAPIDRRRVSLSSWWRPAVRFI